jgi:hypothetical protein
LLLTSIRRRTTRLLTLAAVLAAPGLLAAYTSGPPPDRVGLCFAGRTCKDSNCHDDFPLNSGLATLGLELAGPQPLPPRYRRDQIYRMLASVVDPDPTRLGFGFELAAADCNDYVNAGTISVIDPQRTQLIDDSSGVSYLEHACASFPPTDPADCGYLPFQPGGNSWEFFWRPTCNTTGAVSFHYTINAADRDGFPAGDIIYFAAALMDPPATCPVPDVSLRVVKSDCDPATPGEADVALSWNAAAGASGYAVYTTVDATALPGVCTLTPAGAGAATSACAPMAGAALVFYRVLGLCDDGSPGPIGD